MNQRAVQESSHPVPLAVYETNLSTLEGTITQEQHDAMFAKLPQPLVTAYQYKVRDVVNPKHLCGSYYRTLTPSKIGM